VLLHLLYLSELRGISKSSQNAALDEIPADDAAWIQLRTSAEEEQARSTNRRAASRQRFEHPVTRDRLWAFSSRERTAAKAEVRAAMESALDQDVPRSVRDIFRSLGYRQCVMGRYWFPNSMRRSRQSAKGCLRNTAQRYDQRLANAVPNRDAGCTTAGSQHQQPSQSLP